jgi:hypothetical protein
MPYMKNGHRDYETRISPVPQSGGTETQQVGTDSVAETGQ